MAANITVIRTNVRKDLHDEDASAYRWTDSSLDRHIGRAVAEYSIAAPLEQRSTVTTAPGSRDLSVASLASLIDIEAVEWPVGEFPPRRVAWSQWQTTITMDVVSAPAGVENVYVYWLKLHTLDAGSSTIPAHHDELITEGAAGYAALDWTSYATNRLNIGSSDVWGRYKAFADERLRQFRADIARLGRQNAVRARRLHTTDAPSIFEQRRVKY
ncbi:MAG: phage adaptor protein [Dehalococcoidia bacterium]